jgi:hypothetical protein
VVDRVPGSASTLSCSPGAEREFSNLPILQRSSSHANPLAACGYYLRTVSSVGFGQKVSLKNATACRTASRALAANTFVANGPPYGVADVNRTEPGIEGHDRSVQYCHTTLARIADSVCIHRV